MSFDGAQPETDIPPWMEQTYEVYFRDPHQLLLNMLADPTFAKGFDYTPMQKFDCHRSREYGNFMSGDWAWTQAVRMPSISSQILFLIQYSFRTKYRLRFFVPVVMGSDKTTVSIATSQTEYWPLYASVENLHNDVAVLMEAD